MGYGKSQNISVTTARLQARFNIQDHIQTWDANRYADFLCPNVILNY
jgi:hypothetical protein